VPAPELPAWITADRQRIGDHIRDLREAADLTQGQLVALSGIDRRTLQRIERGETDTRLSRLQSLARGLGVSLAVLVDVEHRSPTRGSQTTGE
jgi:transcriptional regulator with XRE-family HTH domain